MRYHALLASLLLAAPLAAQDAGALPVPPELPRGADANDWEAYFDAGVRLEPGNPREAQAAFQWAARLDPSRAEPLYALWAATHFLNLRRFERYLEDDPRVLALPAVVAADSLAWQAYTRNPFVHRGLKVLLYDQLAGRWANDPGTRAMLAYARGETDRAADGYDRLAGRSERYRFWAVLANTAAGRMEPAVAHLDTLLKLERSEEQRRLMRADESKEMYEYALALLRRATRDPIAARAALERALLENAAFYPARLQMAELALEAGRAEEAVSELRQAVEMAPGDGYLRYRAGVALLAAARFPEAAAELAQAARLEPRYADVQLNLALALDRSGDPAGAAAAYTRFVRMAPRRSAAAVERARRWLAAHPTAAPATAP